MRPTLRSPRRLPGARPLAGAAVAVAAVAALAGPAWAHSGLTPGQVKANTPTDVTLVVEHGCGDAPISKVALRLPPEAVDVTPNAPDDWTVSVTGNVITWDGTARPVLDDLRLGLTLTARAEPGAELPFPVVQTCTDGQEVRWIEDVEDDGTESTRPLPRLVVLEGAPMPATTAAPATTAPPATTAATAAPTTAGTPTTADAATTAAPTTEAGAEPTVIATATTAAGASGATTTVADRSVNSTGGVLAGFGAAAVVVLGGVVLYLRNRRPGAGLP